MDEQKKIAMLKLMLNRITANSHREKVKVGDTMRRRDIKQITLHFNDEFEELFKTGLFKAMDEIGKTIPRWPSSPKGGGIHPQLLRKKQIYCSRKQSLEKPSLTPINYLKGMKWILVSPNVDDLVEMLA